MRALPFLVVLAACNATTLEQYPQTAAKAFCERSYECERGFFESNYSDRKDCVEENTEIFEEIAEGLDALGCEYEQEKAESCLQDTRTATCEEYYEGDLTEDCAEIFDCGLF